MKTFLFNTGVRVHNFSPPIQVPKGDIVSREGIHLIPFQCEDVPESAVFKFACDETPKGSEHLLKRKIHNSNLVSSHAFFQDYAVGQKAA